MRNTLVIGVEFVGIVMVWVLMVGQWIIYAWKATSQASQASPKITIHQDVSRPSERFTFCMQKTVYFVQA